jgi:RNA polymerase sigma factor (sigma-70 family)
MALARKIESVLPVGKISSRIEFKTPQTQEAKGYRFPFLKECNTDKVVFDIEVARNKKKKSRPLTDLQVEHLILNYRANARKLSRSILRRWRARLELEELDSLVDLSLCEAARRYDPNRGASFMTFLYYHLRGFLVRAVEAAANQNTVSTPMLEMNDMQEFGNGEGGTTASDEVAKALCNSETVMPDEELYKREVSGLSAVACSKLDSLEQEVVYRIFVLEENLVDIARTLGYSRCHISRVKKRAFEVLYDTLAPQLEVTGTRPDFGGEESRDRETNRRPVVRRKTAELHNAVRLQIRAQVAA